MNANTSLEDNFSRMQEEFDSSNNRVKRDVDATFTSNLNDLVSSLKFFNGEYKLLNSGQLKNILENFVKVIVKIKSIHFAEYETKYQTELITLKQQMCVFFTKRLVKGDSLKRKLSSNIKDSLDNICDFNIMKLEEEINDCIYNFKIDFENKYINDEYSKDDFNKIIRSFKHSLMNDIRDFLVDSIGEKQDIVSRYSTNANTIVEHYRTIKR